MRRVQGRDSLRSEVQVHSSEEEDDEEEDDEEQVDPADSIEYRRMLRPNTARRR